MFLQVREFADFTVLVDECGAVQVFLQAGIFPHFRKLEILGLVLPLFAPYQFTGGTDLPHVLFCDVFRHREFGPSEYEVVDACGLVRDLVKQTWGILLQLEAVGCLHQCHFLALHHVLRGDVPADDAENLAGGQLLAFPFLYLFPGGIFRRFLVAEFGHQRLRLFDMPVQHGMGFQLVHVFGEPVLELFQLFFVYMVALPHQLEAQPVFHFPHFGYAFLQLIHADKLFRVVGLHFNMEGTAEEYHDFCCEILHAHRRES